MRRGIAFLLIAAMLMGTLATTLDTTKVSESDLEHPIGMKTATLDHSFEGSSDEGPDTPMLRYLQDLDPSGPVLFEPSCHDEPYPLKESSRIAPRPPPDVILLYENPQVRDQWLPLPSEEDIVSGKLRHVSFENRSWLEVHGKLYEHIVEENTTYFDDVGIDDVPINITFDGDLIPGGTNLDTGNRYTYTAPFGDFGNGTFQFLIFLDKPAGIFEIGIDFDGWPRGDNPVYRSVYYRSVIHVNHPTVIAMDEFPRYYTVGDDMRVSGNLSDDTGRIISGVPLQIWFDDQLLGPSSDGVYIDDVTVHGTGYFESFDYPGNRGWSVYSSPSSVVDVQWQHGIPEHDEGPYVAHSGMRLWGTVLDGDYQRGALSFLISPPMNMSMDRSYTLSFWAWWSLYWEEDLAYVMASTDGGSTWDEDGSMMFTEDGLQSDGWTLCEYNVTKYQGSSDVRFAFVFFSDDSTLVSRTDSSFDFTHNIPNSTTAGTHELIVRFEGNLLFREGLLKQGVDVKRIVHFEFEQNASRKVCYRNESIELVVRLIDNEGEVIANNIDGVSYYYQVHVYWGQTPDIGERINGPRMYLDPETGRFSVFYTVDPEHDLGPVNVTFRFGGNGLYTPSQQTDVYQVMAKVYIRLPDDMDFRGFRGQQIKISVELRIVPSQSIFDKVIGDPVLSEFIRIYWDGFPISHRRTYFDGAYSAHYLVPSTHSLGDVLVTFIYEGSSLYDPATRYVNYTIGSSAFITIEDSTAAKGEWITISGSVVDDRGEPAPNVQIYIIWKRAPEIGRATTRADGTFSLQYFVQYEERRGNVTVIARFYGDIIYSASEANATWTIKAITNLERRDHTSSINLGEQASLSAKLYERWDGYRGIEIPNETVVLTIDGIIVASKATSHDGIVVFSVMFDPLVYSYGERSIRIRYGGNEFYAGSTITFTILVRFQGHVTFSEFYINGQTVDPWKDLMGKGDAISGRIRVIDEDGSPLSGKKVAVHYYEDLFGGGWVEIAEGRTDSEGYFEFQATINAARGGILTFIAECEVLTAGEFPRFSVTYIVPPPPTDTPFLRISGGRMTEVGERYTLEVKVLEAWEWDIDNLVYRLVSPPEGMTISSDGIITWTPNEDQVGDFNITVWVSDGTRSETTVLTISVSEKSDDKGSYGWVSALFLVILLVESIFVFRYLRRKHRDLDG